MERREVIVVDGALCGGCGICAGTCPHEALQLVGGRAHLVAEALCAACAVCLAECPHGALALALRAAAPFDAAAVQRRKQQRARLRALAEADDA